MSLLQSIGGGMTDGEFLNFRTCSIEEEFVVVTGDGVVCLGCAKKSSSSNSASISSRACTLSSSELSSLNPRCRRSVVHNVTRFVVELSVVRRGGCGIRSASKLLRLGVALILYWD